VQRCSRRVGLPAPGLVLALAKTLGLSGLPAVAPAQRSDSLSDPLLGFGPPIRYVPQSWPSVCPPRAPLLGFLAPSAHWGEGVHVPAGCPAQLPRLLTRAFAGRSHPASYGVAHRLSQPLGDFFHPPPARRFQAGGAPGVSPSGVRSSRAAPATRRCRHALLTFLLLVAHPPS